MREFGVFARIDVRGIRHDGATYAILLAALQEDESGGLPSAHTTLGPEYGSKLFNSYSAKLKGLLPPPYFDNLEQAAKSLEPTVKRYREAGRYIHMCGVDLKSLLEAVQPDSPTVDIFRFTEDVLRMLYSLVSAAVYNPFLQLI